MKKHLSAVVAICLVVLLAVPAMALDTKFSGQYRVRGFHNSNLGLNDNDASDSYMDTRFRLRTDFMVSDHLTVTTRFDALDNKLFGNSDSNTARGDADNIDFDRAWMTIRNDYGIFQAGRMSGGSWGTSFNDTEGERDRIRWHDSFGDLTLYAIYEKNFEGDVGNQVNDQDFDVYYLGAAYKMENISTGLLYGYVNDKRIKDPLGPDQSSSDQGHLFIPFVMGQFGPFGFQSEMRYNVGEREYDDPALRDRDIDQMALNLEGTFSMDMFQFEVGYAYTSGQGSGEGDIKGYSGIGEDWQKVWILTNSEDNTFDQLGGVGNLASGNAALTGAHIYYGGVTVMPMEKLDIKFLLAYAQADKTSSVRDLVGRDVDKDFGIEYDLFLNYKIYDNLTYSFIAAYLDAGDFWEDAGPGDDLEDNFHLFHQLSLSF